MMVFAHGNFTYSWRKEQERETMRNNFSVGGGLNKADRMPGAKVAHKGEAAVVMIICYDSVQIILS